MSEPREPTAEQPAVAPTVSTDPQPGPWHISRIPSHLGRARTSTLVLGFLFLAIGALWLNIRPEEPSPLTTPASNTGTEQQPIPVVPTTTAPETTAEPTTEAPEPTTAPTTSDEPTATRSPTGTTTAEPTGTTGTSFPTFPSPTAPETASPTVVSPPG